MKIFEMKYLMVLLSITILCSCSKILDINTNPNTSTTVSPDLLFNYALTSWSAKREDGDCYTNFAFLVQNQAAGGNLGGWYISDVYSIQPVSINNVWQTFYQYSGNNLMLAIKQAESSTPVNNNAAAQCKILLANIMYECTTIYGDVPFSQAWNANYPYPKFDAQKDVFTELLTLLDQSIAQIDLNSGTKISNYDLLYNGDMTRWQKFAKSLKLKILMTMVDKDPTQAAAIASLINNGGMISSANDNVLYPYLNVPGKENPKNKIVSQWGGGVTPYMYCNQNVFNYMLYNDPRIPVYYQMGPSASTYIPVATQAEADSTTAVMNIQTLYSATEPDIIFSLQEQLFFEAEVYARGIGLPVDLAKADQLYKAGITAAMQYYQVDSTSTANYLAAVPTLTSTADPVKQIHLQQWIDLQDRPLEAFTQWRRSGPAGSEVPTLQLPPGTVQTGLMRRWLYPQSSEIIPNINAPKTTPLVTDHLWFDL